MKQLMTVQIESPSPPFDKKWSNVAYAIKCLNLVISELGRSGGTASSGNIIGQDAAGVPNTSLGLWMYDASAGEP